MLLKQTTPTFIFHYCNVIDETIYTCIYAHYVKTHNIEFWQFTDLFTHISVELKVLMDNRVHKYSLTVGHTPRHLSKAGSNHIWAQCLCSWHCARYLTQSCCPGRCSWPPHSCLLILRPLKSLLHCFSLLSPVTSTENPHEESGPSLSYIR